MNEDCFEALIWGEQGAEQSLRSTGTVSAELLTQYESAIADLCQDFNGALWPKRLFRILHFASTHLVLRFNVWRTSHANAESSAAGVISEIQFDTA